MELEIAILRENKMIGDFRISPNEDLDLYLRSHERGEGDDQWFYISNLKQKEITKIQKLCKTEEEKELFGELKEDDTLDIILHHYVYIKR